MPNDLASLIASAQDIRGPASIESALEALQVPQSPGLQGVGAAPQVPGASVAPAVPVAPATPLPAPAPATSGLDLDSETRLALISRLDSLKASLLSTPTLDPEIVSEISSISSLINPETSGVPLP